MIDLPLLFNALYFRTIIECSCINIHGFGHIKQYQLVEITTVRRHVRVHGRTGCKSNSICRSEPQDIAKMEYTVLIESNLSLTRVEHAHSPYECGISPSLSVCEYL